MTGAAPTLPPLSCLPDLPPPDEQPRPPSEARTPGPDPRSPLRQTPCPLPGLSLARDSTPQLSPGTVLRLWGNPDLTESWSKHTLCWRFWDPEWLSQGRWEGLSLKPPPNPSRLWPRTFLQQTANSTCAPGCRNVKMNKPDLRPAGGRWPCCEAGREQACPSARGEVGVRAQSPRKPAPRRHPQQTPKRKWSNLRVLPGRMPCPWKTRGPSFHFIPLPLLQPLSLCRGTAM